MRGISPKRTHGEMERTGGEKEKRKMPQTKFGSRIIDMEGAEAAPVSFFIGNTRSDTTKEKMQNVILNCANKMDEKPGEMKTKDVEIVSLTKVPEGQTPRTMCWKVSVPNMWRNMFRLDEFWPLGWSHRPWTRFHGPPRAAGGQKKQRTEMEEVVTIEEEVNPEIVM